MLLFQSCCMLFLRSLCMRFLSFLTIEFTSKSLLYFHFFSLNFTNSFEFVKCVLVSCIDFSSVELRGNKGAAIFLASCQKWTSMLSSYMDTRVSMTSLPWHKQSIHLKLCVFLPHSVSSTFQWESPSTAAWPQRWKRFKVCKFSFIPRWLKFTKQMQHQCCHAH